MSSLYKKVKPSTSSLVRAYDNSYFTSILIPVSKDRSKLYTSEADDSFIDIYGGMSISISGYYLAGTEEYAVIDYVTLPLFFADGEHLNLLASPFIMHTVSFKEYNVDELLKSGVLSESNVGKVKEVLGKKRKQYKIRPEVESKGGVSYYVTYLRSMQEHIKSKAEQIRKQESKQCKCEPCTEY